MGRNALIDRNIFAHSNLPYYFNLIAVYLVQLVLVNVEGKPKPRLIVELNCRNVNIADALSLE